MLVNNQEQISFVLLSLCLIAGVFQLIFLRTYWKVIRPRRSVESQVIPTKLAMSMHLMQFVVTCVIAEGRIIAWVTGTPPTFVIYQWMGVAVVNTVLAYLFNQLYKFRLFISEREELTTRKG